MGRLARSQILYDGCYAHIFSRSLEKRRIFQDEDDFESFRGALVKAKHAHGFQVFHYCLMNTHFHLAVGIGSLQRFSRALQKVKWEYTYHYNRRYKHRGPVW